MDDSDRIDNLGADETTQIQLLQFEDTVGITDLDDEIEEEIPKLYDGLNPYYDEDIQSLLERTYPIKDFTWTGLSDSGDLLTEFCPGDLLFPFTFLSDKINNFNYFRGAIRVSVRINTTVFHAGLLQINYLPEKLPSQALSLPVNNMYQASCLPSYYLSAGSQAVVDFVIPFTHPENWYDMLKKDANYLGYVYIWCAARLTVGNATTPSCRVQIFANFEDTQVAGPTYYNAASGELSDMEHLSITHDSDTVMEPETHPIYENSTVTVTKPQVIPTLRPQSITNLNWGEGVDPVTNLGLDCHNAIAKDISMFSDVVDYDNFGNYIKIPMLVDWRQFDGTAQPNQVLISNTVSPTQIVFQTVGTDLVGYPSPVGQLAQFFDFWRGDVKYYFKFVCNQFTSCRLEICWVPAGNPPDDFDKSSMLIRKVVDVVGTTDVPLSVPFISVMPWKRTARFVPNPGAASPEFYNGTIFVKVLNPPVSSAETPAQATVQILLWAAGGESMEFARLRSAYFPTAASGQVDPAIDMREMFRNKFPGIIPYTQTTVTNVNMGETISSWTQIFSRYSVLAREKSTAPYWTSAYQTNHDISRFLASFLFHRGAIRLKLLYSSTTAWEIASNYYNSGVMITDPVTEPIALRNGAIYQNGAVNPSIELEYPFYTPYNMFSLCDGYTTPGNSGSRRDYFPSAFWSFGSEGLEALVALGSSYSVGFPLPPQQFTLTVGG